MAEPIDTDLHAEDEATAGRHRPRAGRHPSPRRGLLLLTLLFICGLTLRIGNVAETRDMPFVRHLVGDAAGYYAWATRLAQGSWLGADTFYQAPLYPYVIAVVVALFGPHVWVIRSVQALAGVFATLCLYYGTSRTFGRRAGIVASLMLACYAPAIFFDGIIQKTSLGCLLLCGLLALMAPGNGRESRWKLVWIGAVLGLIVLTRENALVWVPFLGLWVWFRGEKAVSRVRVGSLVTYLCGFMLVVGPVALRNRLAGGEWSISTFQAGPNFYIGNHQGADGRYQPLVRGHETPAFERADATTLAEREMGRKLSAREVSRYWMSRAMNDIRADPQWWLGLMGRKMLMVLNRYEVSDAESLYVYKDYSTILRLLSPVWHFGVLCPLAAAGIVCTWHDRRRLWVYYALIISMACAVTLFYVMARYRFPLVPLLIPFAAVGCLKMWDYARSAKWRYCAIPGVVAIAVAIVVNWPVHDEERLNALAIMNVGVALAEEGDLPSATDQFRRAVDDYPASAEANNNLAQALAVAGDHAAAIPYYKAAQRADLELLGVDYNLGVALERVGRLDDALNHYDRSVELDPNDEEARAAAARLRTGGRD